MSLVRAFGKLIHKSGQPAAGIGMSLIHVIEDPPIKKHRVLATAVSQSTGMFTLVFEKPSSSGGKYRLEIAVNDKPIDLPDLAQQDEAWGPLTFVVDRKVERPAVALRQPLVLEEKELVAAWKKEPGLFTRPAAARPPDPCNPAALTDVPARVFYLSSPAMFRTGTAATAPMGASNYKAMLRERDTFFGAPLAGVMRYGVVYGFRQEWWDMGQTLGNLLYSVPLAPCEETKIAAVDWRRRDMATRQTALDENHFQDTTITRDQVVDEAVRLMSAKQVSGSTSGGGWGLSIGPLTTGHSEAASNASEAVDASTTANRSVNDRVHQVSNTVRGTRAFAVAEVTQQEESTVRTRVIRNHNHCHTLTFQYFEVLQVYLLRTMVDQIQPAVFVPYKPLVFDVGIVQQYGYLIRRALLDPTLEPHLDDMMKLPAVAPAPAAYGGAPAAPELPEGVIVGLRASFNPATTDPNGIFNFGNTLAAVLNDVEIGLNVMPDVNGRYVGASTTAPGMAADTVERVGLYLKDDPVTHGGGVIVTGTPLPVSVYFDNVVIEAQVGNAWYPLLFLESVEIVFGRRVVKQIKPLTALPAMSGMGGPGGKLDRLLAHLNANDLYYTAMIISAGDAGRRYLGLLARGLGDIAVNQVVGTVGNYLVFPLSRFEDLPEQYHGQATAEELVRPGEPHERLIAVPTPGIFAESQLGNCSACEKIDDSRFWNWQSSPCADQAPAITADMLASRYQNVGGLVQVEKSDLQPKDVQIPQLPEPMIKIGDATMAALVKDLDLPDSKGVLDFLGGLISISSQHSLEVFKEIWHAYTGQKTGSPGSGDQSTGGTSTNGATAAGGAGAAGGGANGATAGEGLSGGGVA